MKLKRNTHPVIKALVAAKIDPKQFAEEKLSISHQMFNYRLRLNRLHLDHYHLIIHYTGKSFNELFPSPYDFNRQPIALNLKKEKKVVVEEPVLLNPPLKENQEPAVRPVPVPSKAVIDKPETDFALVDVYGGIPKVDKEEEDF